MDASMDPAIRQAIAAVLSGKHCDTGANKAYNAIYDMVCVRCRNTDEARAVCNLLVKAVAVEMDAVRAELAWDPDGVEGPATFLRIFNWSKHVHVQLEKGIMATACSAWPSLDTNKKLRQEIFLKIKSSAGDAKVGDCMARWLARALVVANTDLQQRLRGAQEHGAPDACVKMLAASALPSDAAILNADENFCIFLADVYEAFEEMFEDPWTLMHPHLVSYLGAIVAPADGFVYLTQLLQHALPQVRDRLRGLALELAVDPHVATLHHAFRRLVEAGDTSGVESLKRICCISAEYGSRVVQPVIADLLEAHSADARLDGLMETVDRLFWTHCMLSTDLFDLWRNVGAAMETWLGGSNADPRARKLAAFAVMRVTRGRLEDWIVDLAPCEPSFFEARVTACKPSKRLIVTGMQTLLQKASSQDLLGMELRRCLTIRLATAAGDSDIQRIKETMTAFLHSCPDSMHWRRELLELLTDTSCISIRRDRNGFVTVNCDDTLHFRVDDVQNMSKAVPDARIHAESAIVEIRSHVFREAPTDTLAGNMWLIVGNQVKWRLPILPLDCSPLLADFTGLKTAAEQVYAAIRQGRKLLWQNAYSTATICLHDVRRLYAIVTLVQLAVLRVLDQGANGAEAEIKRVRHDTASVAMACGYSEQHVDHAAKDLRTAGLLDDWSIVYNFERGRQTKPLNVAKLRSPTHAFAPPQAAHPPDDDIKERRFALECAIVKAMKANRCVADINELTEKLAAGGALQFSVDAGSIRAAVDSLASRDYIDTSDGSLRYVA